MSGSGIDERGEWRPVFAGQRPPFEQDNDLAVRHGAHAVIRLAPRAEEIATQLRSIVPACSVADEPTISLLSLVLARVEAANEWLSEHGIFRDGRGEPQPVLRALSTWENTAARLADRLGLTPTSRSQLGLNVARGESVVRHLQALHEDEAS